MTITGEYSIPEGRGGAARDVVAGILGIAAPEDALALVRAMEAGFPSSAVTRLARRLDLPEGELLGVAGMSQSTFSRRKKADARLTRDESDRVYRVARLFARAIEVLGDEDDAQRWMRAPKRALGGARPLDMASTDAGAREVEDLLGRIEHGIPS